jgi:hypothetical protein
MSIPAIRLEEGSAGERGMTRVSLGTGTWRIPGRPEVPVFSRLLAIPRHARVSLEIAETDDVTLRDVHPTLAQFTGKRCHCEPSRWVVDRTFLRHRDPWPHPPVRLAGRGSFHGIEFVQLQFFPVQVLPDEGGVRVVTSLRLVVRHSGSLSLPRLPRSFTFASLARALFLNGEQLSPHSSGGLPSGNTPFIPEHLVIVYPASFETALLPLLQWREEMGFRVTRKTMESIGPTAQQVRTYLQTQYDSPEERPTHVLLAGDVQQVPTLYGVGECASDFLYSTLEGDDLLSDVLVSRLSAKNVTQMQNQVEKILAYERDLQDPADWTWLPSAVVISSSEGDGPSNDDVRSDIVAAHLQAASFLPLDKLYHSMGNDKGAVISQALNAGRSLVTYMGHGSGTAWSTTDPEYGTTHIGGLQNVRKWPLIMDVSCSNGAFDTLDSCFAETWMRARKPAGPTGAIGIYSASTPAVWDEPAEMAIGLVRELLQGSVWSWGALAMAGRAYMLNQYGPTASVEEVAQQYVVFGDSSMGVRSRTPRILHFDGPALVPVDAVFENVLVSDDAGGPVVGAWIHARKGDEFSSFAVTSDIGTASLALSPSSPGWIDITITARDSLPLQTALQAAVTGCGVLRANPGAVRCDGTSEIVLWDLHLNADAGAAESVTVSWEHPITGAMTDWELHETQPDSGRFAREFVIGDVLGDPMHGQSIPLRYDDADCNGSPVEAVAVITLDCQAPVIQAPTVESLSSTSVRLVFLTDEPAQAVVFWGKEGDPPMALGAGSGTHHLLDLSVLTPNTTYRYSLQATDRVGNTAAEDNGGEGFVVVTPDCAPDCAAKQCGPDGCGGVCGVCGPDQYCNNQWKCFGGAGCEVTFEPGCGNCLCQSCVCQIDPYCCQSGWDSQCVWECTDLCDGCGACVPDCLNKQCGSDGCGGSCGDCGEGSFCDSADSCQVLQGCLQPTDCPEGSVCYEFFCCTPDCHDKACGPDSCGGSCGICEPGFSCLSGSCLPYYGICGTKDGPGCPDCSCEQCVCDADPFCCETQWDGQCADACLWECGGCMECQASCSGKECGTDGCGGTCGECASPLLCVEGACTCVPLCESRECGEDGCGGSCGRCTGNRSCVEGLCQCTPDCQDRTCGDDGCGNSCGTCDDKSQCNETGQCVCLPACTNRECGPDGCGGVCGICPGVSPCVDGICDCIANCQDRTCGDDGCGGSCGACPEGHSCAAGTCQIPGDDDVVDAGDLGPERPGTSGTSGGCTVQTANNGLRPLAHGWVLALAGLAVLILRRHARNRFEGDWR